MRQIGLTIIFPMLKGANFDQVLLQASQERTFIKVTSAANLESFRVTYDLESLDRYRALWEKLRSWRGVQHQIEGSNVPFDNCQAMLDCACAGKKYGKAWCCGEAQEHSELGSLAPLFPCRFIPISEANHLGWFQFGSLKKDKVFVVDKVLLRQRIDYYLDKAHANFCPFLEHDAIDKVVAGLPTRLDPSQDAAWVHKYGWVRGRYQIVGVDKVQQQVRSTQSVRPVKPSEIDKPVTAASTEIKEATKTGSRGVSGFNEGSLEFEKRSVPQVTYEEVGGLDAAIAKLRETIELPLKMPELFKHLGISPYRGVLLYGPPGTGKTLLAKALANECDAHFVLVNGPELISKWHGETEANLRRIFEEARSKAPAVILFDEMDALTPERDTVTHNFEAVLVSQFLALMDGLEDRGDVVVVGTTNRQQSVDKALLRPGRLDLQLEIGLPDLKGRHDILNIHVTKMPLDSDVDLDYLAEATGDFTGALLAALCREAGLICLRETLSIGKGLLPQLSEEEIYDLRVTAAHFNQALDEIKQSLAAEQAREVTPKRRRKRE